MAGIYLHIPFCRHACSYCSFYFSTNRSLIADFTDALIAQIEAFNFDSVFTENNPFTTLYFGGGTPSLLKIEQVEAIIAALEKVCSFNKLEEITFELNPENADLNYLRSLKALGINRLSMGVQSFNSQILRHMHRSHTSEEAFQAIENIQSADFQQFNIDLIYAYPEQSLKDLEQDLIQLMKVDPPHISAYALTIEPNTRLDSLLEKGKLKPADDQEQSIHFELVQSVLKAHQIEQYEVSNFAKKGAESKHNSAYWSHQNYLGFGPAAHSFKWKEDEQGAVRWKFDEDLNQFIRSKGLVKPIDEVQLNLNELAEERIMLGLRTIKGINMQELIQKYAYTWSEAQLHLLDSWAREQHIHSDYSRNSVIRLTEKALHLADHLVYKLITA